VVKGLLSLPDTKEKNFSLNFKRYNLTIRAVNFRETSVSIKTQILRNLWGICKNTQLGSNPSLNKVSKELFYTQNGVVNKKIWWFDPVFFMSEISLQLGPFFQNLLSCIGLQNLLSCIGLQNLLSCIGLHNLLSCIGPGCRFLPLRKNIGLIIV
jgi:hypothetical protein